MAVVQEKLVGKGEASGARQPQLAMLNHRLSIRPGRADDIQIQVSVFSLDNASCLGGLQINSHCIFIPLLSPLAPTSYHTQSITKLVTEDGLK